MHVLEFVAPRLTSAQVGLDRYGEAEVDMHLSVISMKTGGKCYSMKGRGGSFVDWAVYGFESPEHPEALALVAEVSQIFKKHSIPFTQETYEVSNCLL